MGMDIKPTGYVVMCEQYTTKPVDTLEAAERWLLSIEIAGECKNPHVIVPVVTFEEVTEYASMMDDDADGEKESHDMSLFSEEGAK